MSFNITTTTVSSSNATNTLAKTDDVLTFVVTFSENMNQPGFTGNIKLPFTIGTGSNQESRDADYHSYTGNIMNFTYTITSNDNGLVTINEADLLVTDWRMPITSADTSNTFDALLQSITGNDVTVDTIAPTISSISVVSNNTINTAVAVTGNTLTFTMNFSENVNITNPNNIGLAIKIPSTSSFTHVCSISSNDSSDVNKIEFQYTVQNGDVGVVSLLGLSVSEGGSIKDITGNELNITLPNITGNGVIVDEGPPPTISSITVASSNSTSTLAKKSDIITFDVEFNESVTITTPSDIKLPFTIGTDSSIEATTNANNSTETNNKHIVQFTYTVQDGDNGSVAVSNSDNLVMGSGLIKDILNQNLVTTDLQSITGNTVTVDTTNPNAPSVTFPTSGTTNNLTIPVTLGNGATSWTYSVNGGTNYNNGTGNTFSISGNTIYSIGAIIVKNFDDAGNSAQISNPSEITIDITAPTISSITVASNNSTTTVAKTNDTITFDVEFNEAVTITTSSDIKLPFTIGTGSSIQASTNANSSTVINSKNIVKFTYSVQDGDNGSVTVSNSNDLVIGSGFIKDSSGNDLSRDLQSITGNTVKVYTTAPTISNVEVNDSNTQADITFSENVYNSNSGSGALAADDFQLIMNNGTATIDSATPTSIQNSSSDTSTESNVWKLGFTITGTADGLEVLKVLPANATAIYDVAGNAASNTQDNSNNKDNLKDKSLPSISSVDINDDNNEVVVTFTENVYNSNSGSGILAADDFQLIMNNGTATIDSATPTSIQNSSSDTSTESNVWKLGFTITGTADGLEVLKVLPANATAIYDVAGNAASNTQDNSNNKDNLKDKSLPSISSVDINDDNNEVVVTFTENVFNSNSGSGILETSDFKLTVTSGDITINSATPNSITNSSSNTSTETNIWTLGFSIATGTPEGNEILKVTPSSADAIYDAAGNVALHTQNNSNNKGIFTDKTLPSIVSVSLSWGVYLNATEHDSDGTIVITTSGVEDGQTVTIKLNNSNLSNLPTITSNIATYSIGKSVLQGLSQGENTITVEVSDAAGNSAPQSSISLQRFTVDTINPGSPNVIFPVLSADGTVKILSYGSGSSKWQYSVDNGVSFNNGNGSTFVLPHGTYNIGSVKVRSVDIAGNISSEVFNSVEIIIGPGSYAPIIICFPMNTPVTTDQGNIPIQNLEYKDYTIEGNKLLGIVNMDCNEPIVHFKKHSLAYNVPNDNTYITQSHIIYHNNTQLKAIDYTDFDFHKRLCVNNLKGIKQEKPILVKTNYKKVYNVVLESGHKMKVNNMLVETLHPSNEIYKLKVLK